MNQSTVLEPHTQLASISPKYLNDLRQGNIPKQGINHILHYLDHVPETVVYKGEVILTLNHLDFIDAHLEGIGWVLLDDNVAILMEDA